MKTTHTTYALAALALLSTLNPMPRRNQVKAGQRLAKGACLIMFSLFSVSTVFAQGSLTPPGAPAPMMKTLAQIEPRTLISSLPFTISNSGSYYLTTNLTGVSGQHGIIISNNDVTLDLNGFALQGVPGSIFGIYTPVSVTNLVLRNGKVRGWGSVGVAAGNVNGEFSELQVSQNGNAGLSCGTASLLNRCLAFTNGGSGISASDNSRVVDCLAYRNTGIGFSLGNACSIRGCAAELNGGNGIQCGYPSVVADCAVLGNGGIGINASGAAAISSCTARNNLSDGFAVGPGSTVTASSACANGNWGFNLVSGIQISSCAAYVNTNGGFYCGGYGQISHCTASANLSHGIQTGINTFVLENQCTYNGNGTAIGAGIYVDFGTCRIEGNNLTGNHQGILCTNASAVNNFIIRNSATGNTTNYQISGTQIIGPIVTATGTITTNNPWANFSF